MKPLWAALFTIFVLFAPSTHAHSWYELQCCSESHCHPVADNVVIDSADGLHVQSFGILSYGDPRLRWSRDNEDHLCISNGKLICVYRRPRDM